MGEYEEKESKAKWKEIAQGALPAGPRPEVPLAPGTPIVVLQQSAALPPRIETRASLDQKYTELPGVSASPLDDAIKETLNNIRQNSTLRFAAIPVFVTIFGALAAAYYTVEAAKLLPAGKLLLPWLGLFTATWFGVVEAFLSRNLILWWSALLKDKKQGWEPIWAHRHANEELTNLLRLVLFLPYAAAIGFWVSRIELNRAS